jgi:hypothetical protein
LFSCFLVNFFLVNFIKWREGILGKRIDRRQKPVWKIIRKPIPPATKPHSTKKGKKAYDRKKKDWLKELDE